MGSIKIVYSIINKDNHLTKDSLNLSLPHKTMLFIILNNLNKILI